MKKLVKKTRLKKEFVFLLGVAVGVVSMVLCSLYIDFYREHLHQCDKQNSYSCNIFGE